MIELKPDVIGVRLKELREKRGLSHEKLADELMAKYGNCLLYTSPSPRDCS